MTSLDTVGQEKEVGSRRVLQGVSFLAPSHGELYALVVREIEEELGVTIELRQGESYDEWAEADVAFICGLPYVQELERVGKDHTPVVAPVLVDTIGESVEDSRYGDVPCYFSDVVVHKGTGDARRRKGRTTGSKHSAGDDEGEFTHEVEMLEGMRVCFNEPLSQSGCGMLRSALHEAEISTKHGGDFFVSLVHTGMHLESIRQVALDIDGSTCASIDSQVLATFLDSQPDAEIERLFSLGPCPNQPLTMRTGVFSADEIARVQARLLRLDVGREDLAKSQRAVLDAHHVRRLAAVDDATYDTVRVQCDAQPVADDDMFVRAADPKVSLASTAALEDGGDA